MLSAEYPACSVRVAPFIWSYEIAVPGSSGITWNPFSRFSSKKYVWSLLFAAIFATMAKTWVYQIIRFLSLILYPHGTSQTSRYDTFQPKSTDVFLISPQKHMLWYSLEVPNWGTSNEYPQHMFSWRNKKNIYVATPIIWSYVECKVV